MKKENSDFRPEGAQTMVVERRQSSQELSARERSGKKDYMTKKWTGENLERKICVYVTDENRKKIFDKTAKDLFNNRKDENKDRLENK